MQSQCRLDWDFLTSSKKELHHRKVRVYETIWVFYRSRLPVCSSFDSRQFAACLARMRDEVLLLHNWDSNYLFCSRIRLWFTLRDEAPLRGSQYPVPLNFLTKYPVSHKLRPQRSRKLKYRPFFMSVATIYFYNIRSLALKRKLEKYRLQAAYCDSCLNCRHSKYGTYQVDS